MNINVRENRRVNEQWSIKRHKQHWAHKTQNDGKKNTTQKTKKMSSRDSIKNPEV
jgi:hypothetical protein